MISNREVERAARSLYNHIHRGDEHDWSTAPQEVRAMYVQSAMMVHVASESAVDAGKTRETLKSQTSELRSALNRQTVHMSSLPTTLSMATWPLVSAVLAVFVAIITK